MEIFTAYTEVDPNNRIGTTTRRTTWVALTRVEDAYVYGDKGVDRFDANFVHYLTVNSTDLTAPAGQATNIAIPWAMSNTIGSRQDVVDASGDELGVYVRIEGTGSVVKLLLFEVYSGSPANGTEITISGATPYYLKVVRDEADNYGTLYLYVYSDPTRATLVGSDSIALHEAKKDFQYVYALQSLGVAAAGFNHDGYTENLELATTALAVTIQPVTAITDTAATGNAIIVDTGMATVTQHGHCWDLTISPTTTDSSSGLWGKTSNGEGSVGSFTSGLTVLLAGQKYWVRAYVTSTEGTVYSGDVTFTAGYTSTQLIQGNLAIVQGRLQYIDAYGKEKALEGQEV